MLSRKLTPQGDTYAYFLMTPEITDVVVGCLFEIRHHHCQMRYEVTVPCRSECDCLEVQF